MTQIMQHNYQKVIETPPVPSLSLYMIWGEDKIRQMVRYHHYLLLLGEIENFISKQNDRFEHATQKTADFFVDILSHAQKCTIFLENPAIKMRYFSITVDEHARYVWLETYKRVIKEMNMPSECIEEFWTWIEYVSLHMINRHTMVSTPRYHYKDIWTEFIEIKPSKKVS